MNLPKISDKAKLWSFLVLCVGLYTAQFVNILKFAVNIPYWDEWKVLSPEGIIANPSLSEFFALHNEHRIVTTKLFIVLLYYINGNNIVFQIAANFIIYGLLIILLNLICKTCSIKLPAWVWLSFTVFLLSTVSYENHFWAFQTQFHFAILFLLGAIWFLFNKNQNWQNALGGVFFSWLLIYSLSSGLVEMIAVLFCYACFKLIRLAQSSEKQKEILQLCLVLVLVSGAIGLYFIGYAKPEHHPDYTFPYEKLFWDYFLNLLSGGFGYPSENVYWGLIIFLFTIIPVIGEIVKKRFQLPTKSWVIIVSILGILAALSSITIGRAHFGIGQGKSSRYSEIVVTLIPLSIAMWTIFFDNREKLRNYLFLAFWFFCAFSFMNFWDFHKPYSSLSQQRKEGVACVENYIKNGGDANCTTIFYIPLKDHIEFGKKVHLSPIEEIINKQK